MTTMKSVMPRLKTTDLVRTVAFYGSILGFEPRVAWPKSLPTFCIIERDGVRIGFSQAPSATPIELSLDVTDAAAWHEDLKEIVTIEWGPEVYSYGRREFAFRDPDGNLLILSEPTDDPPTCEVGL
jgi:catechol 2,3-dioxygenase-like lactoylglutathione lyase family enzyme